MQRRVDPCMLLVGMGVGTASMETSEQWECHLVLLDIYAKELNSVCQRDTHSMFTVIFTILKMKTQPRCTLAYEWMKET